MRTMTLAEARQQFSSVVADVETLSEHVVVTKNGRPAVVIISADEWEEIEETAFWRSVPGIHDDIAEARSAQGTPLAEYLASRTP